MVILGDFNIDMSNVENNAKLTHISQLFNCQQLVTEPTNNHGSIIDLMFSNYHNASVSTLESTWSDHKILFASVPYSFNQISQLNNS